MYAVGQEVEVLLARGWTPAEVLGTLDRKYTVLVLAGPDYRERLRLPESSVRLPTVIPPKEDPDQALTKVWHLTAKGIKSLPHRQELYSMAGRTMVAVLATEPKGLRGEELLKRTIATLPRSYQTTVFDFKGQALGERKRVFRGLPDARLILGLRDQGVIEEVPP